jgi:hypothetical protein
MADTFVLLDALVDFESGELDDAGVLKLFSHLIRRGDAWRLQGTYGRAAQGFIDAGLIDPDGTIDWVRFERLSLDD